MSTHSDTCTCPDLPHRRHFLGASLAAVAALAGAGVPIETARAAALTAAQRDKLSPDDVLALMHKGNRRFAKGERQAHNYLAQQRASAAGQYPFAVLLSCIDSRAPAETIMDLKIGDVFNTRLAGNIENADALGGMEFACKLMGARVILVMGHTGCGAIKGAIDHAELGNLTGLLDKIKPAVEATEYKGERTSKNYAFVDAVARRNVELTIDGIRRNSPVLAGMESSGALKIAGSMYDLKTGVIDFFHA
ncbi:MAG TPA: carbonic anhydrase family protein [Casimicrobiaceae bacterium]|jgi:carbonic anhydrase